MGLHRLSRLAHARGWAGRDVPWQADRAGGEGDAIHVTIAISDRDTFTAATVYLETKLQKLMQ
jgi:hypothetical protein